MNLDIVVFNIREIFLHFAIGGDCLRTLYNILLVGFTTFWHLNITVAVFNLEHTTHITNQSC